MLPGISRTLQAVATELIAALICFALGLTLVLGIPGVPEALRAVTEALFGRPDLPADEAQIALSLALTPLATLLAALLYRQIGRALDQAHGLSERPPKPGPGSWLLPSPTRTAVPPLPAAGLSAAHLVAAVAGSYLLGFLMDLLGAPVAEQPLVLDLVAAGGPALTSLACSALLLAPLGEELFFRGGLFRRIAPFGPLPAYLVSALLFATFHGNLQGFVVYLWLGLVFARAQATTGRLACAVLVHFGNNAITLVTLLSM